MAETILFERQALKHVRDALKLTEESRDRFVFTDMSGLAELLLEQCKAKAGKIGDYYLKGSGWNGGLDMSAILERIENGDADAVEKSDKLLELFETFAPQSRGWRIIDDVAGAAPNVPAFIAGQPLAMRRRARTMSEQAPLAIVVDLASGAGVEAETLTKRGAAVLALVRILSASSPVELWAGCSLDALLPGGSGSDAAHLYFRIDTAPLDLARAAFAFQPSVARSAIYGYLRATAGFRGRWPYSRPADAGWDKLAASVIRSALPSHGSPDILHIPPMMMHHDFKDPKKWLSDKLATYAPTLDSAA